MSGIYNVVVLCSGLLAALSGVWAQYLKYKYRRKGLKIDSNSFVSFKKIAVACSLEENKPFKYDLKRLKQAHFMSIVAIIMMMILILGLYIER